MEINEFIMTDTIYFDTAGAALYGESQIKAIFDNLSSNVIANPHTSKTSENLIDQIRYR